MRGEPYLCTGGASHSIAAFSKRVVGVGLYRVASPFSVRMWFGCRIRINVGFVSVCFRRVGLGVVPDAAARIVGIVWWLIFRLVIRRG